jgi:hypothetical protein
MYSHSTGSRGISSGMSYGKSGTNAASRPPQYSSSNIGVSTFGSSKPSRPVGSQIAGSSSSGLRSSNSLMVALRFLHPQPTGHHSTRITETRWSRRPTATGRVKSHPVTLLLPTEPRATATGAPTREIPEMGTLTTWNDNK